MQGAGTGLRAFERGGMPDEAGYAEADGSGMGHAVACVRMLDTDVWTLTTERCRRCTSIHVVLHPWYIRVLCGAHKSKCE